jgi:hypothetical protein
MMRLNSEQSKVNQRDDADDGHHRKNVHALDPWEKNVALAN